MLTAANGSSFTLVDALYVLGIKKNLLSVSALARLGLVVKFVDDRCTVHDLSFGVMKLLHRAFYAVGYISSLCMASVGKILQMLLWIQRLFQMQNFGMHVLGI